MKLEEIYQTIKTLPTEKVDLFYSQLPVKFSEHLREYVISRTILENQKLQDFLKEELAPVVYSRLRAPEVTK